MSCPPIDRSVPFKLIGKITNNPQSSNRNPRLLFWSVSSPSSPSSPPSSPPHQVILKHGLGGLFVSSASCEHLHRSARRGDTVSLTIGKLEPLKKSPGTYLLHATDAVITSIHVHGNTGNSYEKEIPITSSLPPPPLPPPSSPLPPPPTSDLDVNEVHPPSKKERFSVFLNFLSEKFDLKKNHILDVAGGQGKLSLLLTLSGHSVTLIDPRPNSGLLSSKHRKQLRKNGFVWPGAFKIHRGFFENDEETTKTFFNNDKKTLVVGLHPDEATEAIVDAAIANRRPFAVIPCCIYSRIFRSRTHLNIPVRTYPQFLDYLQAKTEGVKRETLRFGGRNVVVYHEGDYGEVKLCGRVGGEGGEPEMKKAKMI
ncbi:hypothetical protein TrST_g9255 [Triparma strigata]|uniref:Methyltransferase domain-containing protein n=1 Tax=Triparma strigata TaxID=1606541 RepID=A0A9W7BVM5_9STRA|nr:hypothetical protein TrST_g9255 [Triparma strigata]